MICACNSTYVDNLIDAMLLGLENDRALNQAFFITDGERVSWGDFIRAHMALLEPAPEVKEISHAEIEASRGRSSGLLLGSMKPTAPAAHSHQLRPTRPQLPF